MKRTLIAAATLLLGSSALSAMTTGNDVLDSKSLATSSKQPAWGDFAGKSVATVKEGQGGGEGRCRLCRNGRPA
jgi:hypothetical protein